MNNVLKLLFLQTVFLCKVYCETYEYQLPDNDEIKSLNVEVFYDDYDYQLDIRIQCNNYNSLKYLDIRLGTNNVPYVLRNNAFTFVNCFNNETDNENNNFNLMGVLQKYTNYGAHHNDQQSAFETTTFRLQPYAIVNSDVLFRNFIFDRFRTVEIIDVGFTNTNFLNSFQCDGCNFENTNQLDFNNFNVTSNMETLSIFNNKLIHFNSDNLQKLNALTHLTINKFSLDDYNAFNVPGLFEHQNALRELRIFHSDGKIVLHDGVFRGLRNVKVVALHHLQLDSIPPNLFNDMEEVSLINLNSNNIKVLSPTSFEFNSALKNVYLQGNPLFSEPHDAIDQLAIGGYMVKFYFENYTIHTRDTFKTLMNKGGIKSLIFESLETDFKIQDFLNMEYNRGSTFLSIEFKKYPSGYLDWDYLNTKGIAHQKTNMEVRRVFKDYFNAQISLPISGAACNNCWMMKHFFHGFLDPSDQPGFYFESSRTLLKFEPCPNHHSYFDDEYTENCIPTCKCKHNPLTDQIVIDCRNRNFTEFPVIPYPVQYDYDTIHTIDLFFENNLLRHVSFDGQDERVVKKLAKLAFSNNHIESFTMMDSEFNNVKRLNLCTNPMLNDSLAKKARLQLSSETNEFDEDFCSHWAPYQNRRFDPNQYISKTKSADFINQYLNKLNCG